MKWILALFLLGLVWSALAQYDLTDVDEEGDDDVDDNVQPVDDNNQGNRKNPCNFKECKRRGQTCILTPNNKAKCVCREECKIDPDPRHMVCSVKNMTFDSECHLDREYCMCKSMKACSNAEAKKFRLDYYGECKELTRCEDLEMKQFPDRMSNWTYVVMKEMARRHQLDTEYLDLLKKATADDHHTDAILWKFCDLDIRPHDRKVSRRELLFIIASVKPMEHCLVPFLTQCDEDNDGLISLVEWGKCLNLDPVHIEDKCKDIQSRRQ
uniref:SPARC n=3 Tax=Pinctada fucata TaxID=50426 RepID=A0A172QP86_PINFU|nr:SPARC [Pinctada fucata]